MARDQPADFLPSHVIARPDFAQACTGRDLGKVLSLAKQWGGVGFSASHLARRCELTVSRVQDYISGRVQAQRVEIFERVADGLRIPGAMFDLGPRPWEATSIGGDRQASNDVVPALELSTNEDPSVLRRDFVKLGTGIAAAALAGLTDGLPSSGAGNRVGTTTVHALRTNIIRLRRLDDHLGGADTYRLYLAELEKLGRLLKDGSFANGTREALLTLFAEQAQQTGWAAFDAGWSPAAQQLFQRSFDAAREAERADLAGNALALRSYQLLNDGSIGTELTDRSIVVAEGPVHPAVKSLLYQRGAWTYAIAGRAEQAARALGRASEALSSETAGEPAPDWAAWAHNETELNIMMGRCWAELRRPLRAVPALETAMAQYDDSHARDKALYLSWLADAYLDAQEIEQATRVAGHALDLSADVASPRPRKRFQAVLSRLESHKSVPAVSDLLARSPFNPF